MCPPVHESDAHISNVLLPDLFCVWISVDSGLGASGGPVDSGCLYPRQFYVTVCPMPVCAGMSLVVPWTMEDGRWKMEAAIGGAAK